MEMTTSGDLATERVAGAAEHEEEDSGKKLDVISDVKGKKGQRERDRRKRRGFLNAHCSRPLLPSSLLRAVLLLLAEEAQRTSLSPYLSL